MLNLIYNRELPTNSLFRTPITFQVERLKKEGKQSGWTKRYGGFPFPHLSVGFPIKFKWRSQYAYVPYCLSVDSDTCALVS